MHNHARPKISCQWHCFPALELKTSLLEELSMPDLVAMFGGDISRFVPPTVVPHLLRKVAQRKAAAGS